MHARGGPFEHSNKYLAPAAPELAHQAEILGSNQYELFKKYAADQDSSASDSWLEE